MSASPANGTYKEKQMVSRQTEMLKYNYSKILWVTYLLSILDPYTPSPRKSAVFDVGEL